jgi:MFS family permease
VTSSAKWRKRPTKLAYVSLGTFGWYLYALGPSMDFLRTEQGTSALVMSFHMAAVSLGSIFGGALATYMSYRVGRGRSLRLSGFSMAFSLGLLAVGTTPAVTLTAAFLMGVVSTGTVTLTTTFLDQANGPKSAVALAEANMAAAFAGLISPLAVGGAVALGFGWRIGLLISAFMFLVVEAFRGDPTAYDDPNRQVGKKIKVELPSRYWWSWALMISVTGSEFMIVLWNTTLLRDRAGLGDAAAAAGLATFTGGIALGRFILSRIAHLFDNEKLLIVAFIIPLIAFWGMWFSQSALVMLSSLAIFGIGAGMHWPLGIARLVRAGSEHPDAASSRSSYATGGAGVVLPVMLGAIADQTGVHTAFLMVPAVLLAGLALLLFAPKPDLPANAL